MALVLITGGAGFIGSHTADALLKAGHRIRILDNLDPQIHPNQTTPPRLPPYVPSSVEWIHGSVQDPEVVSRAMEGVEVVYHFAACTGVGQSMYDLGKYVSTNVEGTALLFAAIIQKKLPIRRFILSSSRAVYGEGTYTCDEHGQFFPELRKRKDLEKGCFHVLCPRCEKVGIPVSTREDAPLKPVSVYGWTKLAQEEVCRQMVTGYQFPIVILRYFNVYGSRQSLSNPYTGIASIFFSRIRAGNPISIYEQGAPTRDFVHISDVVRANVAAMNADLFPGATFNIGSGIESSVARIAEAIGDALSAAPHLKSTDDFRLGDILSCFADLSRSRRLLGYAPQASLEQGVGEFVSWAMTQGSQDLLEVAVKELQAHDLMGKSQSG